MENQIVFIEGKFYTIEAIEKLDNGDTIIQLISICKKFKLEFIQ